MVVYECEYMVDSRDIDPWYHRRPSGLMGMSQEAATQAACALHVSRDGCWSGTTASGCWPGCGTGWMSL
ncbi:MAG: hypothetical protein ACLT5P_00750 [Flavonifractor plautii]